MAQAKQTKSEAAAKNSPGKKRGGDRPLAQRVAIHVGIALVLILGIVAGVHHVKDYVEKRLVFPTETPRLELVNRPAWMSDDLATQIIEAARPAGTFSAFDHQVLRDITEMLRKHEICGPWIRNVVAVRRVFKNSPGDTIQIECDFRAPVALVHWGDYYWLVDGDGTLLPEHYGEDQIKRVMYGRDGQMVLRIIDSATKPPPPCGQKWPGDDVAAGLDLVKLLYGKPYTEEIERINVGNYGGRINPALAYLILVTRMGTEVHWGRPINAKDLFIEVPPAQKLQYMERVVAQYHRVDGNQPGGIDLRFDRVRILPTTERHTDASGQ